MGPVLGPVHGLPTPKPARQGFRGALAGGLVGAVVAGAVAYGTVKLTADSPAAAIAATAKGASSSDIATSWPLGNPGGGIDTKAVIRQVEPSVVSIEVGALGLGDTPTITRGIVSALDRTLDVDANTTLEHLVQTDASINHGNSGGALVNAAGEVVGINSAGIPDAQNVGFAIAMDTVVPLIEQLRNGNGNGAPGGTLAYLGVSTGQGVSGVTVTGIGEGTPAEAAGLRNGDVIFSVGGANISSTVQLGSALRSHKPGDTVDIVVKRSGVTRTLTAQLGSRAA